METANLIRRNGGDIVWLNKDIRENIHNTSFRQQFCGLLQSIDTISDNDTLHESGGAKNLLSTGCLLLSSLTSGSPAPPFTESGGSSTLRCKMSRAIIASISACALCAADRSALLLSDKSVLAGRPSSIDGLTAVEILGMAKELGQNPNVSFSFVFSPILAAIVV
jgi:hypothetical protein